MVSRAPGTVGVFPRRPGRHRPPGQYVYTESSVTSTRPERQRTFDGPVELIVLHKRQTLIPEDGSAQGIIRENGQDAP
ncbi:hypothetical protein ACFQ08_15140 [Streptosporangium algeriense]|uniref:Uncharacterized protein n=1 Tax=Streptosporangium algeriense TaxID=1682748 RepID=A0ABW3DPX5_9ACTN